MRFSVCTPWLAGEEVVGLTQSWGGGVVVPGGCDRRTKWGQDNCVSLKPNLLMGSIKGSRWAREGSRSMNE